tara:strand:+ start:271 stop:471 length:201 start_codon:yes stop_codon:yes gene_type:complete
MIVSQTLTLWQKPWMPFSPDNLSPFQFHQYNRLHLRNLQYLAEEMVRLATADPITSEPSYWVVEPH